MKVLNYVTAIACLMLCSSCQLFCSSCQLYEENVAKHEHQKIVISPYVSGGGFVVLMKQEDAIGVNAPQSHEFKKMLEDQLAVEKTQGHSFCPFGYEIRNMINFLHSPTTINIDCQKELNK